MTHDMSKLPQWVQAEIVLRDRRIASLEKHIGEMSSEHPESRVKVAPRIPPYQGAHDLPDGSEVEFYLGDSRERYHQMISAKVRRGAVEIMAHGWKARERLAVSPRSGNVVGIYFAEERS